MRYNARVTELITTAKVSHRGQASLPASLRHRWGIEDGGHVAFVDLGDAALVLPGGIARARAELRERLVRDGAYERGVAALNDPDLADQ
jgi:bifunctional DNA-binding transcriptional regulator/antitoxin component of YhaV-PrlF toxin-antitoxin module